MSKETELVSVAMDTMGTGPINLLFLSGSAEEQNARVEFVENTSKFSCIDKNLCVPVGIDVPVFMHHSVAHVLIGSHGTLSNKWDLYGCCETDRLVNILIEFKTASESWDRTDKLTFAVNQLSGIVGSS